jgi:FixJ family two-component response regulator
MAAAPSVFVVDDDAGVREMVCLLAETAGLEAKGYASAEAFWTDYAPGQRGCLVLDSHLPGMSGLDLLEKLNAQGSHLPVIMASGNADATEVDQAKQLGAVDFVNKPADVHVLLDLIRRVIGRDLGNGCG